MLNDEAVYTHLAFIVAMPDAALQPGRDGPRVPFRAGELGYPVRLLVLDPDDARDLITAPIRTHLAYQASDLELLLRETGGHPYYIHLVCSQIITAIQAQQRRIGTPTRGRQQIDSALVRAGLEAVLANKDAFHHVLADNTPGTSAVLRAVAALTGPERPAARRARLRVRLRRLDPQYGDGTLAWAIEERPDLLFEQEDEIGIRVNLVARWLRRHVIYPLLEGDGLAPGSFDTQTQEPRR